MAYKIATVSNIPIYVDWSLILLLLFVVSDFGNPLFGIAVGVGVAASIVLHELGHSLVAQAFGCRVRDITLMLIGGYMTIIDMPRKVAGFDGTGRAAGERVDRCALPGCGVVVAYRSDVCVVSAGYSPASFSIPGDQPLALLFQPAAGVPDGRRTHCAPSAAVFMTRPGHMGRLAHRAVYRHTDGVLVLFSFLTMIRRAMLTRLLIAYFIYTAPIASTGWCYGRGGGATASAVRGFSFGRAGTVSRRRMTAKRW